MKKKNILFLSCFLSVVGAWINLELNLSSYNWWYWSEHLGYKWIMLFHLVIPLFLLSMITRFILKVKHLFLIDIYSWLFYFSSLFIGFLQFKKIKLFESYKIFTFISILVFIVPCGILIILLYKKNNIN